MKAPLHVVILAAGQGTRMQSRVPKVLHPIAGKPLLGHVLDTARKLGAQAIHVVHGHGAEQVRARFANAGDVRWTLQAEQLGTGHAVLQALPGIPDHAVVLVLYGDVPLIAAETLQPVVDAGAKGLALLTAQVREPAGYGRILRRAGAIKGIVEEKDATAAQRRIAEINTGFLAAPAKSLRGWLGKVGNRNAKGEYYLTDIVAMAGRERTKVAGLAAPEDEILGVNDRAQLAKAERRFQRRQAARLMAAGLAIVDPARFDLRGTLRFGRDCTVDVGAVLEGDIELGDGVAIGPYTVLRAARIGSDTRIESHCTIEAAEIGANCRIGPFARIRPETRLADDVHVGNFVEVKKSTLGRGAKANHLAYVGDASIGARTNVGAGVITVNYDGAAKHRTVVGDDAFIGSDTQLIAPVQVGAGATIGAGSTVTRDVPAGGLTICRAKEQKHYPHWKRPRKDRES